MPLDVVLTLHSRSSVRRPLQSYTGRRQRSRRISGNPPGLMIPLVFNETYTCLACKLDQEVQLCWVEKCTCWFWPTDYMRITWRGLQGISGSRVSGITRLSFPRSYSRLLPSFFYSRRFYLGLWVTQIATKEDFDFQQKSSRITFPHTSFVLEI
jgi:hypothetical protein